MSYLLFDTNVLVTILKYNYFQLKLEKLVHFTVVNLEYTTISLQPVI